MTPRRKFLCGCAGLAGGALLPLPAGAQAAAVRELSGSVLLNGRSMTPASAPVAGDSLFTGASGQVSFTIGGDAIFLRPGSELRLVARARETLVNGLRLVTGRMGATFGRGGARSVIARTVTIGIRGTGVYVETTPEETYACTCFGATELTSNADGSMMERVAVSARNHEARRIYRDPQMGMRVVEAGFERHTNEEMTRLEALAGRPNPFRS